jgi:hypothetical protein
MTLKDLLDLYNDDAIISHLIYLYPKEKYNKSGYRKALKTLRHLKPKKTDMKLRIETVTDDFETPPTTYVRVDGLIKRTYYAIEFTPWAEWLSSPIMRKSLKEFHQLDILCHCLWEMTWDGFEEEQIQGKIKELNKRVEEIKKDLDKKVTKK